MLPCVRIMSHDCLLQRASVDTLGDESFFDLLSRFQSNRMDDQRCTILDRKSSASVPSSPSRTPPPAMKKCELLLQSLSRADPTCQSLSV